MEYIDMRERISRRNDLVARYDTTIYEYTNIRFYKNIQ